jgi:hypothetical protein
MATILARARVPDYAQWLPKFQQTVDRRRAGGLRNEQIFRNPDDPTDVTVVFEVDEPEAGRQYLFSEGSRQRQHETGGVVEAVYLPAQ